MRSKRGIEVLQGLFDLCGFMVGRGPAAREATRSRLTNLLREYRDKLRAFKEAVAAGPHAELTRKRNVVQARLVRPPMSEFEARTPELGAVGFENDARIPMASFTDDLARKQSLKRVMGPHESEDTHPGGDPALAGQVAKEDANYRYAGDSDRRCENCKHFDGASGCALVGGIIRKVDTCDLFEPGRAQEAIAVFKRNCRKYPQ